ncbi:hypothetical protein B5X24_HaOG209429 [Helicoverpa armigera]|uniref:Secreted protein n=1 Tax=Helicoverpa armigera TaxID=29058 RepID=A0A2W1BH05_HELAM|nr:hypothetical protein B5X24_HaOG209429 [Helicoverpa armigera]
MRSFVICLVTVLLACTYATPPPLWGPFEPFPRPPPFKNPLLPPCLMMSRCVYVISIDSEGATSYSNVEAHSGSVASGGVKGSTFGNGALSAANIRPCGPLKALFHGC